MPLIGRLYSPIPWRVDYCLGQYEVWTKRDDTPGSLNNFVICDGIQTEEEALLIAKAPELLEALADCYAFLVNGPNGCDDTKERLQQQAKALLEQVSGYHKPPQTEES